MEQKLDRIIELLERIAHVEKPVIRDSGTYTGTGLWFPTVTTTQSIGYNGTWKAPKSTSGYLCVDLGGDGGTTKTWTNK